MANNLRAFLESGLNAESYLEEQIYGNMATVYHRTKASDLVNRIFDSGFKPGDGALYGRGFYATYELKSQMSDYMRKNYGNVIVKFAVPIQTFLVFDYEEFQKSPNFNKLGKPSKDDFLFKQFDFFKIDYSKFREDKIDKSFSSETALWCYRHLDNLVKLCEGMIYTGKQDGKSMVVYNTDLVMPLALSFDEGKTWEDVDLNKKRFKNFVLAKSRFFPDLDYTPEDFGITKYEFDGKGLLNVFQPSVTLTYRNLKKLPFHFGKVEGDFYCFFNKLETLEGAPIEVLGDFGCSFNKLETLEYGPKKGGGLYVCSNNKLKTLKGAPDSVGKDFYCNGNNLDSLKYLPKDIGGDLDCSKNKREFSFEEIKNKYKFKGKIIL